MAELPIQLRLCPGWLPVFALTVALVGQTSGDAAEAHRRESFLARFVAERHKGYQQRSCGFDMNRNGLVGEAADRLVGDGKTNDPDGDGVNEDILYVDAEGGRDATGDGSRTKPFQTIQRALDAADGPQDGAEDIICIAGVFYETLVMRHGGVPGHYVRDGFRFPKNPSMIIGWDKDGDGQYPPYDPDDTAVLDGRRTLAWAIANQKKLSYLEIAHLTIRNYGYGKDDGGALRLFRWGDGSQSHIDIHDVEFYAINEGEKDASGKIVLNFWGGPMTDVAFVNNRVERYSSYFCRGAPPQEAGRFRFQNNTLTMFGTRDVSFVTGWKLWGHHRDVEILDNVLDCNSHAWQPAGHVSGIGVCQGTQRWTIRGNVLIDLPITLQPFAAGYPFQRTLDEIVIGRNIFRSTYAGWRWPPIGIKIQGYRDAPAHQSVEDATITNNFFSTSARWRAAILCTAGNGGGPQRGAITIAGNTFCGPFDRSGAAIVISGARGAAYRQDRFVIKNNLIANVGDGVNLAVDYAPTQFVADGNIYDPAARFRWNNPKHWESRSFSAWRQTVEQDVRSTTGTPTFVDFTGGDLHLANQDDIATRTGVDIRQIAAWDIDGDSRSASHPEAGADVPARWPGRR